MPKEIREGFMEEGSIQQMHTESPPHTRLEMTNVNKDTHCLPPWNLHSREGDRQESNKHTVHA